MKNKRERNYGKRRCQIAALLLCAVLAGGYATPSAAAEMNRTVSVDRENDILKDDPAKDIKIPTTDTDSAEDTNVSGTPETDTDVPNTDGTVTDIDGDIAETDTDPADNTDPGQNENKDQNPENGEPNADQTNDNGGKTQIPPKEETVALPEPGYTGIYAGKYYKGGSLALPSSTKHVMFQEQLYLVETDGSAVLFTGVYKGYYYKKGSLYKKGRIYYAFYNGYLYQVNESAQARKYKKDKRRFGVYFKCIGKQCCLVSYQTGKADSFSGVYNGKYYKKGWLGESPSRYFAVYKKYLYRISPEGEAKLFRRNKRKNGMYPLVVGKKCYNVSWRTGSVSGFTGVYQGVYYRKGKVKVSSKPWYAVYDNYLYQVETDGTANRYKKDITKIGTYQITLKKKCYNVYYKNGKAEEATMTLSEIRRMVARRAAAYLGYNETNRKHRKIIDTYNKHKPLAREYSVKYKDAWCATFVSALAIKLHYTDLIPTECSCKEQIALWQSLGRWQEDDAYVPRPGDLIYYDWTDDGKGDCTGESHHVGVVERVSHGKITVIEGNYGNAVRRRVIRVNGRYIRGFGLPDYANKAVKKK